MQAEPSGEKVDRPALVVAGAWDGVEVLLQQGEVLALLGPAGSGKSELMRICGGLQRPARGQVWVAGRELWGPGGAPADHVRRSVGWVLPEPDLDPLLTVEETVVLGARASSPNAAQATPTARLALEAVGLAEEGPLPVGSLGANEGRLVAIALVLAKLPALVIADEPALGLDQAGTARVFDLLAEAADSGSAVLFATRDRSAAMRADRVLELPTRASAPVLVPVV